MPRHPPPVTASSLDRDAERYLLRYNASVGHLRRLLMHRVKRSARDHGTDLEKASVWVDTTLNRLVSQRALDDAAFATMTAETLWRRGKALGAVRVALRAKGLAAPEVEAALAALRHQSATPDLEAAITLARRRRLGPFRGKDRADYRRRDLAVLGRAGFAPDVARRVIDATDEDALRTLVEDGGS